MEQNADQATGKEEVGQKDPLRSHIPDPESG